MIKPVCNIKFMYHWYHHRHSQDFPMQLIYQRKTSRCHPNYTFPEGFNIAHTENYCSNEAKCLEMIDKIILPYIKKVDQVLRITEKSGVGSHSWRIQGTVDTNSKKERGWFERKKGACTEQHDRPFKNTGIYGKSKRQSLSAEEHTKSSHDLSTKTIRKWKATRERQAPSC